MANSFIELDKAEVDFILASIMAAIAPMTTQPFTEARQLLSQMVLVKSVEKLTRDRTNLLVDKLLAMVSEMQSEVADG